MEPLTAASAFATIVGLLSNFKAERHSVKPTSEDFLRWLEERGFVEIASQSKRNSSLLLSIEQLLKEEVAVLEEKFAVLDRSLASLASMIGILAPLAEAVRPNERLSKQAISILVCMEEKQATSITTSYTRDSPYPSLYTFPQAGTPDCLEPRFLEDDLKTLVKLGLLRPGSKTQSGRSYGFTRDASRLVRSMGEQQIEPLPDPESEEKR